MQAIIFIGLQGAGKSSFYKERFFNTHVRVNLDMLKTRRRERLLLAACLDTGQPFVVDNTNPSMVDRAKYIEPAKEAGFEVVSYYFVPDLQGSRLRNSLRPSSEQVPVGAIYSTLKRLQPPTWEEGFGAIYSVSVVEDGGFVVEAWTR